MVDYSRTCAQFSWATARQALDGLPDGRGLKIAHEAVDRHADARHLDAIGVDGGANRVWIADEELHAVFVLQGACANGTGRCTK